MNNDFSDSHSSNEPSLATIFDSVSNVHNFGYYNNSPVDNNSSEISRMHTLSENDFSPTDNTVSVTGNGDSIDSEQPHRGTKFDFKHRGFHMANLNIRHIKPKVDNMKIMLDKSNSIDIFGVCETFLNGTISDDVSHINNYKK